MKKSIPQEKAIREDDIYPRHQKCGLWVYYKVFIYGTQWGLTSLRSVAVTIAINLLISIV